MTYVNAFDCLNVIKQSILYITTQCSYFHIYNISLIRIVAHACVYLGAGLSQMN